VSSLFGNVYPDYAKEKAKNAKEVESKLI